MSRVTGKLGVWEVPEAHMWKDRSPDFVCRRAPIVGPNTAIATIGSCFASELAGAMGRLGLKGAMHPSGLFYTSRSIRQEFERIFAGRSLAEESWRVRGGFVHPLMEPGCVYRTEAELRAKCRELDDRASELFRSAEVIVVTLGLIESWVSPKGGLHYRQIPHPDVFPTLGAAFCRLSVSEIRDDLERIQSLLLDNSKAKLVVTVSPIPLHVTFTGMDVRVANQESKGRIRAAVSEFVETHPEVAYFHSYELVVTAEDSAAMMVEDGRHLKRDAVDGIVATFLSQFGAEPLQRCAGVDEACGVVSDKSETGKAMPIHWLGRLLGPRKRRR